MKHTALFLLSICLLFVSGCQEPISSGFTTPQILPGDDVCGTINMVLNEQYWFSSKIQGVLTNDGIVKTMTLTGANADGSKLKIILKDFTNLNVGGVANGEDYKMANVAGNTENSFSFEYTNMKGEVTPITIGTVKVTNCDVANRTINMDFEFQDGYPMVKYSGVKGKVLTVCYKN